MITTGRRAHLKDYVLLILHSIVREIGAASTVLLKNVDSALPLRKPRSMTLFGLYSVTLVLLNFMRLWITGLDAGPQPGGPNQFANGGGNTGILAMGWGSGTANVRLCWMLLVSLLIYFCAVHVPHIGVYPHSS